jgi:hypothetical protein
MAGPAALKDHDWEVKAGAVESTGASVANSRKTEHVYAKPGHARATATTPACPAFL